MLEAPHISRRLLIRDLVRRHPGALVVLHEHGVQATYAHLSVELAAKASCCPLEPLLTELRSGLLAISTPIGSR